MMQYAWELRGEGAGQLTEAPSLFSFSPLEGTIVGQKTAPSLPKKVTSE